MRLNFSDKLYIGPLAVLQLIVFYLWYQSVLKEGTIVFNHLGVKDVWFLPVVVLLFVILNFVLALSVFRRHFFLRLYFLIFSFVLTLLEIVVLAYYVILA